MGSLFSFKSNKPDQGVDLSRALNSPAGNTPAAKKTGKTQEMRRAARKSAWCECSLRNNGVEIRAAVVLDVSESGVRVRFHTRGLLPEQLQIKASRIGLDRMARVAWQTTSDAGLEFIQPGQKQAPAQSQIQPQRVKPAGFGKKRT